MMLHDSEFSKFAVEPASSEGETGVAVRAAPASLDGVSGMAGAGEEEGEGVAEVVELVEVGGAAGLAIEDGDGLEGDEDDVGCVGTGPGDGILGPLREKVDVGAGYVEFATLNGIGVEFAGANGVTVVEERVIAPADVEAVVVAVSVGEKRYGGEIGEDEGARECKGDGDRMRVPEDRVGFGAGSDSGADCERGDDRNVFEVGAPPEHSGGERSAADGGAGLQAECGGGPRWSVDHGGDAETGDVLELEEAVDEGVQKSVAVAVEDADGEELGRVEDDIDNVGGAEGGPHHVEPVPVIEGVGRLTKAVARGGIPIWIPVADTGVGEAGPPRARMARKACCSKEASWRDRMCMAALLRRC